MLHFPCNVAFKKPLAQGEKFTVWIIWIWIYGYKQFALFVSKYTNIKTKLFFIYFFILMDLH